MGLIAGKINIFDESTLIFEDGDDIEYVAYIKSGSILYEGQQEDITYIAGEFIGTKDLYTGFYSGDYTASAGSEVMIIPADSPDGLYEFLSQNPNIQLEISYELCVLITKLYDIYQSLYNDIEDFYNSIIAMHQRYVECSRRAGIQETEFLEPHPAENYKFSSQDFFRNYNVFNELAKNKQKSQAIINANGVKFLKIQNELIHDIYTAYDDMVYYLKTIISLFASKSDLCLFSLAASLSTKASGKYKKEILALLTDMKKVIENIDEDIRNNSGLSIDIDYNRVNFFFMTVESMDEDYEGEASSDEINLDSDQLAIDFLTDDDDSIASSIDDNSSDDDSSEYDNINIDTTGLLKKLCDFAGFDETRFAAINDNILKFISLADKFSREDSVRLFRKEITNQFFELYEEVFIRYAKEINSQSIDHDNLVLIQRYLDFGFIDERLLTDSQIHFLLSIHELEESGPCNVYRMKDWLMKIYLGEEPTSKNEFDMDYNDTIRERKKTEALSAEKERELLANNELKARFEIKNLLKYNLKLVSGNILGFFPMLHMDCFEREIENLLLSSSEINNAITKLMEIDYSVFYREMLYSSKENNIGRANIQKEFYPNIILLPTSGNMGVMWQETAGKRIGSSGRFLLPALFSAKLEDILLTMFGRFRFELCKTAFGGSWNNIQVPSLTSEYSDYVQFYKKNKELSTEKKEALKTQVSRCRNSIREIFVYDYIIWMKYESAGAIRLNKVARRMLATYCPFSREIRSKIASQPIFADAMTKFQREKIKKIKEVNNMIINLERSKANITEEILETKRFYEEL